MTRVEWMPLKWQQINLNSIFKIDLHELRVRGKNHNRNARKKIEWKHYKGVQREKRTNTIIINVKHNNFFSMFQFFFPPFIFLLFFLLKRTIFEWHCKTFNKSAQEFLSGMLCEAKKSVYVRVREGETFYNYMSH